MHSVTEVQVAGSKQALSTTRPGLRSATTAKVWTLLMPNEFFEPYAVAHSGGVSGSVGLGLTVSRQLAELMGGTLSYYCDLNESVFRLDLPLAGHPEPVLTSKKAAI